jgi:hypothetical protein
MSDRGLCFADLGLAGLAGAIQETAVKGRKATAPGGPDKMQRIGKVHPAFGEVKRGGDRPRPPP